MRCYCTRVCARIVRDHLTCTRSISRRRHRFVVKRIREQCAKTTPTTSSAGLSDRTWIVVVVSKTSLAKKESENDRNGTKHVSARYPRSARVESIRLTYYRNATNTRLTRGGILIMLYMGGGEYAIGFDDNFNRTCLPVRFSSDQDDTLSLLKY